LTGYGPTFAKQSQTHTHTHTHTMILCHQTLAACYLLAQSILC